MRDLCLSLCNHWAAESFALFCDHWAAESNLFLSLCDLWAAERNLSLSLCGHWAVVTNLFISKRKPIRLETEDLLGFCLKTEDLSLPERLLTKWETYPFGRWPCLARVWNGVKDFCPSREDRTSTANLWFMACWRTDAEHENGNKCNEAPTIPRLKERSISFISCIKSLMNWLIFIDSEELWSTNNTLSEGKVKLIPID